jgi:endoglucanase
MSVFLRLSAACVSLTLLTGVLASPAQAATYERILNGTFDEVKTPWWSSANTPSRVESGKLCADIPAGTVNPWNSMIGQDDVPVEAGQPYTLSFTASASKNVTIRAVLQLQASPFTTVMNKAAALTATPKTFVFTANSTVTNTRGQMSFQMGGATEAYTLCVDDVSVTGGVIPPGGIRDLGSPVRVNQHGYLVTGPKRATIVNDSAVPLPWQLLSSASVVVATGSTQVYGADAMSGDYVHVADFSLFQTIGSGYSLVVGTAVSLPFDIGTSLYDGLRRDALAYFYHNRSGLPIEAQYVGDAYARPAGHIGVAPNQGDTMVACLPGTCDYALDVRGGWYDAGDHGKYVVNGALAAWQLMDLYESSLRQGDLKGLRDDLLRIPETGNGTPDVLDEARWQMEFLLRMQVPAGQALAGMAHHKIHDVAWTGLPLLPSNDPQARYLYPPSTAATLNLAATAAQCARIWASLDPAFAARCLSAAGTAWQAALAHPAEFAPRGGVGGGPYDDTNVTDEFSWAAAELYATTRDGAYLPSVTTEITADGFSWQATGALADLTIVRLPGLFPADRFTAARARVIAVADKYFHDQYAQGYPNPYLPADGKYVWGSNSSTTNNALVMGTAYDLTHDNRYRSAVLESMDYLLGRNALNQSYVSGYGERASHNQHHRFWAKQLNPALPSPPPGSIAGGPNSGIQDPVAQRNLPGCAPAKCYLDEIGSWATNEVAVNWNSSLAWMAAFADSRRPTTSTTITSSASPSTVGGAITFTATVNALGGTVQFTVDGQPLGGPVALASGMAVSEPIATLATGAHTVVAAYSGGASYLDSSSEMAQLVYYGVAMRSPAEGAQYRAGSIVPITLRLNDAAGNPIPSSEALRLFLTGRVTVSASGAQGLDPVPMFYNPFNRTFVMPWFTVPKVLGGSTGAVTITVAVAYPGAPDQLVTIPLTLT